MLPEERRDAEEGIIRTAQQEGFRDECNAFIRKHQISTKSVLLKINPCLDEQGLIRSGSRLRYADLRADEEFRRR